MITYNCNKKVHAVPMTRLDYNILRGWELPANENGSDKGYLVEYIDGGKPNHFDYEGYISWSPKEQFDNGYRATQNKVEFAHIQKMALSLQFKYAIVPNTTTTACWAILPNGFQVAYGESACVDPSNFNKELGEKYALERCLHEANNNLWKLEGYLLAVTANTSK